MLLVGELVSLLSLGHILMGSSSYFTHFCRVSVKDSSGHRIVSVSTE